MKTELRIQVFAVKMVVKTIIKNDSGNIYDNILLITNGILKFYRAKGSS